MDAVRFLPGLPATDLEATDRALERLDVDGWRTRGLGERVAPPLLPLPLLC